MRREDNSKNATSRLFKVFATKLKTKRGERTNSSAYFRDYIPNEINETNSTASALMIIFVTTIDAENRFLSVSLRTVYESARVVVACFRYNNNIPFS